MRNDSGEGTVSAASSSGGFSPSRLVQVSALPGAPAEGIEHTGITHETVSQAEIVRLLGVRQTSGDTADLVPVSLISTGLLLSTAQSGVRLIELGIVDPIELATTLYDETVGKINGLIGTINAELNQDLPILGQSVNDLIGVEFPLLDLDGFVSGLSSPIAIPTGATLQDQLADLESSIETALGLAADELSFNSVADITSTGSVVLTFAIDRSGSKNFDLDLSSLGPLSGNIPGTL
ncbi:MAG: hypothetical protein JJ992_27030, partial [Planctomycetes bacterium]|nr:hypothetical protein [Planctomycetota bacterium]